MRLWKAVAFKSQSANSKKTATGSLATGHIF